jgi:hypothetical protein
LHRRLLVLLTVLVAGIAAGPASAAIQVAITGRYAATVEPNREATEQDRRAGYHAKGPRDLRRCASPWHQFSLYRGRRASSILKSRMS